MCNVDKRVTIVVPIYKDKLEWNEEISLSRILAVFSRYPIIFILPVGKNFSYLPESDDRIRQLAVPAQWMMSLSAYNKMMLSASFYEMFANYEYIMICQLDTFVFDNKLDYFCQLGYDYYGAPWPVYWRWREVEGDRVPLTVGNGGFSLRRVSACRQMLLKYSELVAKWDLAEDLFWAYIGEHKDKEFRCAPLKVARDFSVEAEPERYVRRNGGRLPFGCHGWHRYSKDFYMNAINKTMDKSIAVHTDKMRSDDDLARRGFYNLWLFKRLLANDKALKFLLERLNIDKAEVHIVGEYLLPFVSILQMKMCVQQVYVYDVTDEGCSGLTKALKGNEDQVKLVIAADEETEKIINVYNSNHNIIFLLGAARKRAQEIYANMSITGKQRKRARKSETVFFSCAQNEPSGIQAPLLKKLQEKAGLVRGETDVPGLYIDFNFGVRIEVPEGNYRVNIQDALSKRVCFDGMVSGKILVSMEKYFIPWSVYVYQDEELIFCHHLDLRGQKVFFELGTALGDMLAILPYVLEFGRHHGCTIYGSYCANFAALLDEYVPGMPCLEKIPADSYAAYVMGAFQDTPILSPVDGRLVPLDKMGQVLLGMRQPVEPLLFLPTTPISRKKPYVCISVQASGISKCWLYPNGWNIVVEWLNNLGYEVIDIDGDAELIQDGYVMKVPDGAIDDTGRKPLTERVELLRQAACFIGGSSGLAWLARATGIPCVLISGITIPCHDFDTPYRVQEYGVCHGCYNDVRVSIKKSLCPYHAGTERQYECSKQISPEAVIEALGRCLLHKQQEEKA